MREYVTEGGRNPFREWLLGLKDSKIRNRVVGRLLCLADGSRGDWKSVGSGLFELRIHIGAGYRIYCGQDGDRLIIVLVGGDKRTQRRDIKKAHDYWTDYKTHR